MKFGKKLVAILSCSLAAVFTFGVAGCGKGDKESFTPVDTEHYNYDRFDDDANFVKAGIDDSDWDGVKATAVNGGFEKGTAIATQKSEYIRTLDKNEIVKPVAGVVDEHETYGVKEYPAYGKVLKGYTVEERDGLIRESHALAPNPTWKSLGIYDAIDSEGYLLKNGQRILYSSKVTDIGDEEKGEGDVISGGIEDEDGEETPVETGSTAVNKQYSEQYRKLYKHTAALTHFGGGLSDDEPRIVKTITAFTHTKLLSTQITGLYAPAGEVIKIEMSQKDYRAAGGIKVLIGQNYNLGQHVSMETSGNGIKGSGLNRMPDILSIFLINDSTVKDNKADTVTAYVGSFFGGPIYFSPVNINATQNISVTISGGVRYQHFILGSTTPEEYELDKASTAPYFDLEVYDAVRFTTTKHTSSGGLALKDFTYENCTDAAILWDKIAEVSTRVAANGLSASSAPVYIIGDCYIAAGAAFANPGRNGVVCPPSWLAEALNYNSFVNSGSWGTMHEYNHCWQGYGFGNGGEVSNNATTLVSYSLYTRISQSRTMTGGLSGWGRYSDPAWAMCLALPTTAAGNKIFDLSAYATLLHNIGQDNFVAAARGGREAGSTIYYNNLVDATHYDMTYYFTKVLNYGIGETLGGEGNPGKIGNLQKSAVDAVKEKNYPVFVPVSSVYQVGRSIIKDNKKDYITTAQPFSYGTGEFTMDFNNKNGNGNYSNKNFVIPDGFTAKVIEVTQPENGKTEMLGNNLVKYTPKNGEDGLYSGNFRVKLRITKDDGEFIVEDVDLVINLKQSADTNLFRTTYVYDNEANVPETDKIYNSATKNFDFGKYSSTESKKNVCTQETNTQIWAAGRNYDDDVYNKDSTNYRLMPNNKTLQTMEGVMYFSAANTYRFTLKGRGKATLYLSYDNGATWESALTISRSSGNAYINGEYSEHTFTTKNNYVYFKVVLLVTQESDFFGVGVSSKQANGSFSGFTNAANALTNASVDLDKIIKAEASKKFETDYHFKNVYSYGYTAENKIWASGNKLVSVSHANWVDPKTDLKIDNMFDGNTNTYYHSVAGEANYITADKPFELVVDLGSVCEVNRVYFNGFSGKIGNNGMVKSFKIYGSTDGKNFDTLVTEVTDSPANAKNMTFNFDTVKIRYYKLVVTDTDNHHYFAMCSIVFSNYISFGNGTLVSPSDFCVRYDGNWSTTDKLSNFGIIYEANAGASVEYHFTGTRVAYFANKSADYGTVDIYVDGKLVAENVSLSAAENAGYDSAIYDRYNIKVSECSLAYMYTGEALAQGDHVIKIVGKSGNFNVDSFAYWG